MLGVTDLWTYVLGTLAIVLLPGPNSLYVLSTAARHGVRAGYRAAAGVFLGDWVLMTAAALGVASLLRAYPPVFMVVKYAGAGVPGVCRHHDGGCTRSAGGVAATLRTIVIAGPQPSPRLGATGRPQAAGRSGGRWSSACSTRRRSCSSSRSSSSSSTRRTPTRRCRSCCSARFCRVCSALYLSALIFGGTFLAAQFRRRRRLAARLTAGVGAVFVGFGIRLATASLG